MFGLAFKPGREARFADQFQSRWMFLDGFLAMFPRPAATVIRQGDTGCSMSWISE